MLNGEWKTEAKKKTARDEKWWEIKNYVAWWRWLWGLWLAFKKNTDVLIKSSCGGLSSCFIIMESWWKGTLCKNIISHLENSFPIMWSDSKHSQDDLVSSCTGISPEFWLWASGPLGLCCNGTWFALQPRPWCSRDRYVPSGYSRCWIVPLKSRRCPFQLLPQCFWDGAGAS